MKKIAKEIWEFIAVMCIIAVAGASFTAGAITAAKHMGIVVGVAYEEPAK